MGKTIWKFSWPGAVSVTRFEMPKGAEVLYVASQNDIPCIWCKVDADSPSENRLFRLVGTGEVCPDGQYVGSVQIQGGDFIFHIFEHPA